VVVVVEVMLRTGVLGGESDVEEMTLLLSPLKIMFLGPDVERHTLVAHPGTSLAPQPFGF